MLKRFNFSINLKKKRVNHIWHGGIISSDSMQEMSSKYQKLVEKYNSMQVSFSGVV